MSKQKRNTIANMTKAEFKQYCLDSKAKTNKLDLHFINKDNTINYVLKSYRAEVKATMQIDCKDFKANDFNRVKRHLRFRIEQNARKIRIDKKVYTVTNLKDFDSLVFTAKTRIFIVR
jgi:hypothetical protein